MGTRKRSQALAAVAGLVALLLGLAGTYDNLVESSDRLLGGPFEALILLGPALVAVGIVALFAVAIRSLRTGGFLKALGGAMMVSSVALLVLGAITGSEIIGFYSTMSLFLLALPGLGLFLVGGFLVSKAQAE